MLFTIALLLSWLTVDTTYETMVWHTFVYKYPAAQQALYGGFCAKVAQFR